MKGEHISLVVRLQLTLVLLFCCCFCDFQAAAANTKTATLTIVVYPCQKALGQPPVVSIYGAAKFLLKKGVWRKDSWWFYQELPSGYYEVTSQSVRCEATGDVAILPGVRRVIGIVERAELEKQAQTGALAGIAPIGGLRVFVSPRRSPSDSGAWARVDGRQFYAESLKPGDYRLFVHFGNCCGFTQDATVTRGALTVVQLDVSRFYAQAFAQRLSESSLSDLVIAADGTPWFVEYLGITTRIAHLDRDGALEEYQLSGRGNAYALTPDPNGGAWFIADGDALDRITPRGQITKVSLDVRQRYTKIARASDGSIWMADFETSVVGRYDPSNQRTHAYVLPRVDAGGENTSLMAASDGTVWYTSLAGNRIVRFSSDGSMTQATLPWNCGPNRVYELGKARLFSCWRGADGAGMIDDPTTLRARPLGVPATNDGAVAFPAQLDQRVWFIDRKGSAFVGVNADGRQRVLQLERPLNAFDLVAANHRLWFVDSGTHEAVSVGLDGRTSRVRLPPVHSDAIGGQAVNELVPDAAGNVWFLNRHDFAIYRIGPDDRVDRLPIQPKRVEALH